MRTRLRQKKAPTEILYSHLLSALKEGFLACCITLLLQPLDIWLDILRPLIEANILMIPRDTDEKSFLCFHLKFENVLGSVTNYMEKCNNFTS